MTEKQRSALDLTREEIARGRGSVDASFVAARTGWTVRQASGVMQSLDRAGLVRAIPDGFVRKTFYVLR